MGWQSFVTALAVIDVARGDDKKDARAHAEITMATVQRLIRDGTTMAPSLRKLSVCGGLTARVRTRSQAGPPHAAVAP
jgi:hypothetical protein